MKTTRSFWRFLLFSSGEMLLACGFAYLWEGYVAGEWWSANYIAYLFAGVAVFIAVIWMFMIPSRVEATQDALIIQHPFRQPVVTRWDEIESWRRFLIGRVMIKLGPWQYQDLSIFAFPKADRQQLIALFNQHIGPAKRLRRSA